MQVYDLQQISVFLYFSQTSIQQNSLQNPPLIMSKDNKERKKRTTLTLTSLSKFHTRTPILAAINSLSKKYSKDSRNHRSLGWMNGWMQRQDINAKMCASLHTQ